MNYKYDYLRGQGCFFYLIPRQTWNVCRGLRVIYAILLLSTIVGCAQFVKNKV